MPYYVKLANEVGLCSLRVAGDQKRTMIGPKMHDFGPKRLRTGGKSVNATRASARPLGRFASVPTSVYLDVKSFPFHV